MKYCASIQSLEQLQWALDMNAHEVIAHVDHYSREGGLTLKEFDLALNSAKKANLPICLAADRLVEERPFDAYLENITSYNCTLRVQDLGLAYSLNESGVPFQLLLDTGNANKHSLEKWQHIFKNHCQRIILNNEIPSKQLFSLLPAMQIPTELLGFGPLLMYYSKRALLSSMGAEQAELLASSVEAGPGDFRFKESPAGTVMYNSKELCLLEYADELEQNSLKWLRVDLRYLGKDQFFKLKEAMKSNNIASLKKSWPKTLLHGYYGNNRSDSVFKHLPKRKMIENKTMV
ncbi:MAG: U32 family peptidase, partial [Planctomycetes bacterium]|nr:U32 family peptidase [Planctomycetota bacterium]